MASLRCVSAGLRQQLADEVDEPSSSSAAEPMMLSPPHQGVQLYIRPLHPFPQNSIWLEFPNMLHAANSHYT